MKRAMALAVFGLACLLAMPSVLQGRYADGMNVYEYVQGNPVARLDPNGSVVFDANGKNCELSWNRAQGEGEKFPNHDMLFSLDTHWDYGPDYQNAVLTPKSAKTVAKYGGGREPWYDHCGALDPCEGKAPFIDLSRGGGRGNKGLLLDRGFLIFKKRLEAGPSKGKLCECATCGDITGCLDAVQQAWNRTDYDHWFHNCVGFVDEAVSKCCLRKL